MGYKPYFAGQVAAIKKNIVKSKNFFKCIDKQPRDVYNIINLCYTMIYNKCIYLVSKYPEFAERICNYEKSIVCS